MNSYKTIYQNISFVGDFIQYCLKRAKQVKTASEIALLGKELEKLHPYCQYGSRGPYLCNELTKLFIDMQNPISRRLPIVYVERLEMLYILHHLIDYQHYVADEKGKEVDNDGKRYSLTLNQDALARLKELTSHYIPNFSAFMKEIKPDNRTKLMIELGQVKDPIKKAEPVPIKLPPTTPPVKSPNDSKAKPSNPVNLTLKGSFPLLSDKKAAPQPTPKKQPVSSVTSRKKTPGRHVGKTYFESEVDRLKRIEALNASYQNFWQKYSRVQVRPKSKNQMPKGKTLKF